MQKSIPYTLITAICTVNEVDQPWYIRFILWLFDEPRKQEYYYNLTLKADGVVIRGQTVALENGESFYVVDADLNTIKVRSLTWHLVPLQFNEHGVLAIVSQSYRER